MKNVVIIGGGFAGVRCAVELSKSTQFNITLIDQKDYFEVSFAQLASLVDPHGIGIRSRFLYSSFLKCNVKNEKVKAVSKDNVILENGASIDFDILVIASGSSYQSFPIGKPNEQFSLSERNLFFISENEKLKSARNVIVIGGGPVGVELVGEIASKYTDKKVTLVHGTERILEGMSIEASRLAAGQLKSLGVEIILNERLQYVNEHQYASTITNKILDADIFYNCIGSKANTGFMIPEYTSSLNERGLIMVDDLFRVKNASDIYAIGDCNDIKEPKLGSKANMHGALLAENMIKIEGKKTPSRYVSKKPSVLVPIGRDHGVVQLSFGIFTSKFLIHIKTKDFLIGKFRKIYGLKK